MILVTVGSLMILGFGLGIGILIGPFLDQRDAARAAELERCKSAELERCRDLLRLAKVRRKIVEHGDQLKRMVTVQHAFQGYRRFFRHAEDVDELIECLEAGKLVDVEVSGGWEYRS